MSLLGNKVSDNPTAYAATATGAENLTTLPDKMRYNVFKQVQ